MAVKANLSTFTGICIACKHFSEHLITLDVCPNEIERFCLCPISCLEAWTKTTSLHRFLDIKQEKQQEEKQQHFLKVVSKNYI